MALDEVRPQLLAESAAFGTEGYTKRIKDASVETRPAIPQRVSAAARPGGELGEEIFLISPLFDFVAGAPIAYVGNGLAVGLNDLKEEN